MILYVRDLPAQAQVRLRMVGYQDQVVPVEPHDTVAVFIEDGKVTGVGMPSEQILDILPPTTEQDDMVLRVLMTSWPFHRARKFGELGLGPYSNEHDNLMELREKGFLGRSLRRIEFTRRAHNWLLNLDRS